MKKAFLFILALLTYHLGFGQIKPVQNIVWNHWYANMQNYFTLGWAKPEMPHNEIIGFNIYSGSNLYKFQNESSFVLSCNPDFGQNADCSFLTTNNGYAFTGYIAVVYEGNIESEHIPFSVGGVALDVNDIQSKPINIFPNPVKDILNFSEEVSNIKITDLSGKIVNQISDSEKSINISKLSKGTYIISATTKSGETVNKKFIKE